MGLRRILTDKESSLHKVCKPVTKFDWRLHKLLDDMAETLAVANGVGYRRGHPGTDQPHHGGDFR